jgi:quercetin dioxygenase-like cupin family protein
VKFYRFDAAVARPITQFGSVGAAIAPVARPGPGAVQLGCMHLAAGGRIGRHPASGAQLFLVVAGAGWVAGADGARVPLNAGEAAFWEPGEDHESGTERGMTALVLEADEMDPAALMPEVVRP